MKWENMNYLSEPVVRIKIVGVGGGGKNVVERMLETNIPLVNYATINTDDGAVQISAVSLKTPVLCTHRQDWQQVLIERKKLWSKL